MRPELYPSTGRHPHASESVIVGRYELAAQLARGGLATVYAGRLRGDGGLQRTVAVKRLHAQFRTDEDMATMFLDEARVALRLRHPNVIHAVDVVLHEDELFIVMEYVEGASLSQLLRNVGKSDASIPLDIVSGIITNVLRGLHAAHTTHDERGAALGIIHRDVTPQNVLVGVDGVARVLDFGIAKTVSQAHVTRPNEIKGKLNYIAPEQLLGEPLTCKVDIFSAGVVLWEMLTAHRLFFGDNDGAIIRSVLESEIVPPSSLNHAIPRELDELVLHALERDVDRRLDTAEEMAARIETIMAAASPGQIGAWVRANAEKELASRAEIIARVEGLASDVGPRSYDALRVAPRSKTTSGIAPSERRPATESGPFERARPRRRGALAFAVGLLGLAFGGYALWHRTPAAVAAPESVPRPPVSFAPIVIPAPSTAAPAAPPGASPTTSSLVQGPVRRPSRAKAPVAAPSASSTPYTRW